MLSRSHCSDPFAVLAAELLKKLMQPELPAAPWEPATGCLFQKVCAEGDKRKVKHHLESDGKNIQDS